MSGTRTVRSSGPLAEQCFHMTRSTETNIITHSMYGLLHRNNVLFVKICRLIGFSFELQFSQYLYPHDNCAGDPPTHINIIDARINTAGALLATRLLIQGM